MLYFINLGTLMCYATGALVVGGGSYTAWCFKDTISNSVIASNNSEIQSTNNIPEKFTQQLENAQKHQEEISQTEADIEKLTETISESTQELEELKKTIEDLKADIAKRESHIKESYEQLELLKKDKDTKTSLFASAQQALNDQKAVVSNHDVAGINQPVIQAQQELQTSDENKEKSEQDLKNHKIEIDKLTHVISESDKLLKELNSKKLQTEQEISEKTKLIQSAQDDKRNKINSIKTQINTYISELSSSIGTLGESITQLNKEIISLQQEIDGFGTELNAVNSLKKDDGSSFTDAEKQQITTAINAKKANKSKDLQTKKDKLSTETTTKQRKETEKTQLQQQHDDLSTIKTLNTDNTALANAISQTISEVNQLGQNITTLTSDKNKLNDEKDGLISQIKTSTTNNSDAVSKKTTLDNKTDDLTNKKATACDDHESKKQALLVAQTKQTKDLREIGESTILLTQKKVALEMAQIDLEKITKDVVGADAKHQELEKKHSELKDALSTEEENHNKKSSELNFKKQQKSEREKAAELQRKNKII